MMVRSHRILIETAELLSTPDLFSAVLSNPRNITGSRKDSESSCISSRFVVPHHIFSSRRDGRISTSVGKKRKLAILWASEWEGKGTDGFARPCAMFPSFAWTGIEDLDVLMR